MNSSKKRGAAAKLRHVREQPGRSWEQVMEGFTPPSLIKTSLGDDVGLWRERLYRRLTTLKI